VSLPRTLAAAEVHLAVGNERLAIVAIGPGVGGGRMTGDEMKDGELVFDRAHAVFQRIIHLSPPAPTLGSFNPAINGICTQHEANRDGTNGDE
jgi:hypothetical protein